MVNPPGKGHSYASSFNDMHADTPANFDTEDMR